MDLSVIVPAYNEEKVIAATLKEINSYLLKQTLSFEIIVVDDGSEDQTTAIIKGLKISNLVLLENGKNLGKGSAVKRGVLASKGDLILFLDADNSTSIENLSRFREALKQEKADIAIASRALADSIVKVHQPKCKEISGKLGNFIVRLFLVQGIKDTQCGFKLFKRECIKLFELQKLAGWGFDFEILFLAKKLNFKILELPVDWINEPNSKVKFYNYFKTLAELIRVRLNNLFQKYKIYD